MMQSVNAQFVMTPCTVKCIPKRPMIKDTHPEMINEISCRVTRTLLMYGRENNNGSLGSLLNGLPLDADDLSDTNN